MISFFFLNCQSKVFGYTWSVLVTCHIWKLNKFESEGQYSGWVFEDDSKLKKATLKNYVKPLKLRPWTIFVF